LPLADEGVVGVLRDGDAQVDVRVGVRRAGRHAADKPGGYDALVRPQRDSSVLDERIQSVAHGAIVSASAS